MAWPYRNKGRKKTGRKKAARRKSPRRKKTTGRRDRVTSDRFGNAMKMRQLIVPRNGNGATIEGLAVANVMIGGKPYRIQVSGVREQKGKNHVGWVSVIQRQRRRVRNF